MWLKSEHAFKSINESEKFVDDTRCTVDNGHALMAIAHHLNLNFGELKVTFHCDLYHKITEGNNFNT